MSCLNFQSNNVSIVTVSALVAFFLSISNCIMAKNLAIILVSIHLMGNTELGQLFKLPQLVQHFFQHQHIDPRIGFFEFLAMHYSGDDGTTADDDFDKQLPYHNTSHNPVGVVYSPMIKDLRVAEVPALSGREYNEWLQPGVFSKHVQQLIQPPRTV